MSRRLYTLLGSLILLGATVSPVSAQTLIAGGGSNYFGNGSSPASPTSVNLRSVRYIAVDPSGDIYLTQGNSQLGGGALYEISATTGDISEIAGDGSENETYSGDGGPAVDADLDVPGGIAVDSNGNIYFSDPVQSTVREIYASTGDIDTIAGNIDIDSTGGYSGDGGLATEAALYDPSGLAVDSSGNIYIADTDNCVIRKITVSTGVITTVAGKGPTYCAYSGNGGSATSAELYYPNNVAIDSSGDLFIASLDGTVREVNASTGDIALVAGLYDEVNSWNGDTTSATSVTISPGPMVADSSDDLFISAGTPGAIGEVPAGSGDIEEVDPISNILGLAIDSSGNLYAVDEGYESNNYSSLVYKVD